MSTILSEGEKSMAGKRKSAFGTAAAVVAAVLIMSGAFAAPASANEADPTDTAVVSEVPTPTDPATTEPSSDSSDADESADVPATTPAETPEEVDTPSAPDTSVTEEPVVTDVSTPSDESDASDSSDATDTDVATEPEPRPSAEVPAEESEVQPVAPAEDPEPSVIIFTPPQPTFDVLPCHQAGPQTRVNLPQIEFAMGSYTINGTRYMGGQIITGDVVLGFEFGDGVQPPEGWPGLQGFTPEACPTTSVEVTSLTATPIDKNGARSIDVKGSIKLVNPSEQYGVKVVVSIKNGDSTSPLAIDIDGNFSTVLTGTFPDGTYEISAQGFLTQDDTMTASGDPKTTSVVFKTTTPEVIIFTPPQPTFEALPCVDGVPQTRVVFPSVDSKMGYYYTNGEKETKLTGSVVLPGQIRLGFEFSDGVQPPAGWAGLQGFTPKECLNPAVQVSSLTALAVEKDGTRSINVSGSVATTDIQDLSKVTVVISLGGKQVASLAIDASGNFSTVLTGVFPDGTYEIGAVATATEGETTVTSDPKATSVTFKTVPVEPTKPVDPPKVIEPAKPTVIVPPKELDDSHLAVTGQDGEAASAMTFGGLGLLALGLLAMARSRRRSAQQ